MQDVKKKKTSKRAVIEDDEDDFVAEKEEEKHESESSSGKNCTEILITIKYLTVMMCKSKNNSVLRCEKFKMLS